MAQLLTIPVSSSLNVISCGRSPSSLSGSVSFPISNGAKFRSLSIKCVRVGGVEIPDNKRIEFSLQYIHGIGRSLSRKILNDLKFPNKRAYEFNEEELTALRAEVSKYMIEGDLRRFTAANIQKLKDIMCYRGIRHIQGLPCRGQRTRTNARTLKGRRAPVAGKKKAPAPK